MKKFLKEKICPKCKGIIPYSTGCERCKGAGIIVVNSKLTIKEKFESYRKLSKEISELEAKVDSLSTERSNLFLSKFKTTGKFFDANAIFKYVKTLKPKTIFSRFEAEDAANENFPFSKESLKKRTKMILENFVKEGLLKKVGYSYQTVDSL